MSSGTQRHNERRNASKKVDPTSGLGKQERDLLMWLLEEEHRIQETGTESEQAQLQHRGVPFSQKAYLDTETGDVTPAQSAGVSRRIRGLKEKGLLDFDGTARYLKLTTIGRAEAERLIRTGGLSSREAEHHQVFQTRSGPVAIEVDPPFHRAKRREAHEAINKLTAQAQGWLAAKAAVLPTVESLGEHPMVDYLRAKFDLELTFIEEEQTKQRKQLEGWSSDNAKAHSEYQQAWEMHRKIMKLNPDHQQEVYAALPRSYLQALTQPRRQELDFQTFSLRLLKALATRDGVGDGLASILEAFPAVRRRLESLEEEDEATYTAIVEQYQQWESPRMAKARRRRELRDEHTRDGWSPPED